MPDIHRLSLWVKVIYGIGSIPNALKTILFGLFTLYFYTTVMGLRGTAVGIATAIGLVWDAIIDPIIGALSDNMQSRFGKRHGLMLIGSAGMGVSFWMYFSPPANICAEALFSWLLVTSILVRTMTSLFCIPYYALGAELSQDYHERTSITGIRGMFALLGTLATATLCFILFSPVLLQEVDPKRTIDGYRTMGLLTGFAMTLVGLTSTFGTLSYRQHPAIQDVLPVRNAVRDFFFNTLAAFRNPSFRSIFTSYSIFFLGTVINASLAIHFLTYYVNITASAALSVFQLSFYLGALAGVAYWLRVSRRLEKRSLYFGGTLVTSMIIGCAFLLLGEGHLLGIGNLKPLLFGHGLAGFFACTLWIVPASMIADVADQDELLQGQRREGIFFGLFNFGEQIAGGAAIFITGFLIDRFAGLIPGQVQQSAGTVIRIGMLYSLLPSALLAVAAFIILRYSLDQNKIEAIRLQLNKKRGI